MPNGIVIRSCRRRDIRPGAVNRSSSGDPRASGETMFVARRQIPALLTAVLSVFFFGIVPAQAAPAKFQFFPWYGYGNFAKNVNVEDESMFGANLGLTFAKYVGVQ